MLCCAGLGPRVASTLQASLTDLHAVTLGVEPLSLCTDGAAESLTNPGGVALGLDPTGGPRRAL